MQRYEVARTLVKSPPELWEGLSGDQVPRSIEGATARVIEDGKAVAWQTPQAHGTVRIEPSGWGTRVTLTAEVEEQVARRGLFARLRRRKPPEPRHADMEQRLERLLDELASVHKKPFTNS